MTLVLAGVVGAASVQAQGPKSAQPQDGSVLSGLDDVSLRTEDSQQASTGTDDKASLPDAPTPAINRADANKPNDQLGKQPKRILGIIPNFRAVSANTQLPPLSFKEELWLATQDTFDYSDVIFVGGLAGIAMAGKSQPSFGQGGAGYGRYYWHLFVDGTIENYMTEAIVPAATREDPRYYTLGKGGFIKRSGYAVSRLFITRTDAGNRTFNLSEIVGAGASAGIGNTYYPAQSNPWVKTYQRWGTQVGLDGVFNVLKEFWPDINQAVFRGKY
ncbi:MAG: hypothetical protein WAU58_13000 [Terriglobales bacterium]